MTSLSYKRPLTVLVADGDEVAASYLAGRQSLKDIQLKTSAKDYSLEEIAGPPPAMSQDEHASTLSVPAPSSAMPGVLTTAGAV